MTRTWGLWLAATVSLFGFGGLAVLHQRTGTLRFASTGETIFWYLVAFSGFGIAVWWNESRAIPRWVFWSLPVLFRIIMLTTTPTLSDDVYRYLWDGHLGSEGVNPYAFPINDAAADQYDIPARSAANNPDLSSPYLPVAHSVFTGAALAFPSEPLTMQLVMVAFDLMVVVLLSRLLALADLPRKRLLLYLWNPLVVVEIAHGAHLDALMMALTAGALVLTYDPTLRSRAVGRLGGPILLALAILTRPIPALLLPVVFWRWTWRQRLLAAGTLAAAVLPFGLGPGYGLTGEPSGTGVFGSARVYAQSFRFNSGIYHWAERWISSQGLDDRGWDEPIALTRLIFTATTIVVLIVAWLRARPDGDLGPSGVRLDLRRMMLPLGAYVVLTPVMHPWYLLIIVMIGIFATPVRGESALRWVLIVPWIWLGVTSVFSYLTYRVPNAYAELEWVRRFEWIPMLVLLAAVSLIQLLSSSRRAASGPVTHSAVPHSTVPNSTP